MVIREIMTNKSVKQNLIIRTPYRIMRYFKFLSKSIISIYFEYISITDTETDIEIHRYRDAEFQRYRDTEIQRYRDTEIQRYRDTEIQRYRDTEIQWYRDTEIERYRYRVGIEISGNLWSFSDFIESEPGSCERKTVYRIASVGDV
jgi:hypothetical protein